jgi:hypothetical protein
MNKTTRFVLIAAAVFAGCTAIYYGIHFYTHSKIVIDWSEAFHGWHYPTGIHTVDREYEFHSLWMPRYLGIAWPAFAIAVSALCMRLPGPVMRWAVISLLLSANCANSFARIYLNPEPRLDKVIADVRAAQDRSGPVRTYLQPTPGIIPHPGQQWINSVPSRYYLAIQGGPRMPIGDLSAGHFGIYNVLRPRENISPWMIALDKKIAPQVDRIIVWEHQKDPLPTDDKILAALGSNWSMASEENYHAFGHWMWNSTALIRRREYIKTGDAPTTMPATKPTTRPTKLKRNSR